jgi:phosphatidylserine decarboxylase
MTIHKEGIPTLTLGLIVLSILSSLAYYMLPVIFWPLLILCIAFYFFLISFFRKPSRPITNVDNSALLSPCDGKVVVIEKVFEPEYLKADVLQVSIFMSPLNVHINYFPTDAKVLYAKHHPGKFLVAWHPKSSTENERTTVCYDVNSKKVLLRQVAGALARRIVMYAEAGKDYRQGDEMGFIKFGSRVDIYLPLDTVLNVQLNDVVSGSITKIASL